MTVHVVVRARLRVDAAALTGPQEQLLDAVGAAARRALTRSRDVARGGDGDVTVRLHPPAVTWTGAGLPAVPAAVREGQPGRLAGRTARAVHAAGLWEAATPQPPTPPPPDPNEPVPGLEVGESTADIPLDWQSIGSPNELGRAILASGAAVPSSGYLGALYRSESGELRLTVVRLTPDSEELNVEEPVRLVTLRSAVNDTTGLATTLVGLFPARADYRVRARPGPAGEVFRDALGAALRAALAEEPGNTTTRPTAGQLDAVVDRLTAEGVRLLRWDRAKGFVTLYRDGDAVATLPVSRPVPTGLDAPVIPLLRTVPAEPPAVVHATVAHDERPGGLTFPTAPATSPRVSGCAPFLGEPALADLAADGESLRRIIDRIATELQIEPCDYAAGFLFAAVTALGERAWTISGRAERLIGTGRIVDGGFEPSDSPGLQLLRHLAGVIRRLTALAESIRRIYQLPEHQVRFADQGRHRNSWLKELEIALAPRRWTMVRNLFAATCRLILLEQVRASRAGILARREKAVFAAYAAWFELMLRTHALGIAQLRRLRHDLIAAGRWLPQSFGEGVYRTWRQLHDEWDRIRRGYPLRPVPVNRPTRPGTIVRVDGKPTGITDRHGRVWTGDELDAAIELAEQAGEAVDPLIAQIRDVDQVLGRAALDPTAVRTELAALLDDMVRRNADTERKLLADDAYAVRIGLIVPVRGASTVPGLGHHLQGIHLQAHAALAAAVGSDPTYVDGLKVLLQTERGAVDLAGDVASLLGFLPGGQLPALVTSLVLRERAEDRTDAHRSLLAAGAVVRWADAEAELFGAELGLVLNSLLPGRNLAKGIRTGLRATAYTSAAGAVRRAGRRIAVQALREITERLSAELVEETIKELVKDAVIDYVLQLVVTDPAIAALEEHSGITTETVLRIEYQPGATDGRP